MTRAASGLDGLTRREREIAEAAASGAPVQELAAQLFLSPRTVETHLIRIYRKLGVRSRAELVALVLGDQRRDEAPEAVDAQLPSAEDPSRSTLVADPVQVCPGCQAPGTAEAKFCLVCGLQFTPAAQERRKLVTLLYCAVTNSVELGEVLDAEVFRHLMNAVYDACRSAIERHQGAAERLFGDAVLATFGVPTAREDDALRAVRAALDAHEAVRLVSVDTQVRYGVQLRMRMGINTGEMVVGATRSGGSIATGRAVNLAAQLEKSGAPGETLIGEMTRELLGDWVEVEELPARQLPGTPQPQRAFRLLHVHDRRSPGARTRFVGRRRELAVLQDSFARVIDTQTASLVTLVGDAGLGKSRLVDEFVAGVEPMATVLSGRCLAYGDGIAFWPVVEIVRSACGLDGGESPDKVEEKLAELVGDHAEAAGALAQLTPLLIASGEPGSAGDVIRAVVAVIEQLAANGPVVVCVDDVHWAKSVLLDLIEVLLQACRDLALLIVVEARPELLSARPTWGSISVNTTTLRLEALARADAEVLVGEFGDFSGTVADQVVAAAGGNPLYLEQLAAHARNTQHSGGLVVPPTLRALLTARLDQLDETERALVSDAAVIGQAFRLDELASLSRVDTDVAVLLERLAERQVVRRDRAGGGGYRFQHVLVQQAAYDAHPKVIRAERHRDYAGWLVDHPEVAGGELAALRGWHLEQAYRLLAELAPGEAATREVARAAATSLADASRAREGADPVSAVAFLRRAVALTDEAPAKLRRLIRLAYLETFFSISFSDLADTLAEAEALPPGSAAEQALLTQLKLCHQQSTNVFARADIDHRTASAAEAATAAAGWLWGRAASARLTTHELQVAGAWSTMLTVIDHCIAFADAAGERNMRNEALRFRAAVIRWGSTPASEAIALLSETMSFLKDEPEERERVQMELAVMHALTGDAATARATLPPQPPTASTVAYLCWAFCRASIDEALGDETSAACVARDAAQVLNARGDVGYSSTLYGRAAAVFALIGDTEQARQLAGIAQTVSPEDDPESQSLWRLGAALVAASDGDGATVERLVAEALPYASAQDSPQSNADCYRYAAAAMRSIGLETESVRLASRALELYRRKGATVFESRCEALLTPAGCTAKTNPVRRSPRRT